MRSCLRGLWMALGWGQLPTAQLLGRRETVLRNRCRQGRGGMLEAEQDVAAALNAGALAASTSSEILWARSSACLKR